MNIFSNQRRIRFVADGAGIGNEYIHIHIRCTFYAGICLCLVTIVKFNRRFVAIGLLVSFSVVFIEFFGFFAISSNHTVRDAACVFCWWEWYIFILLASMSTIYNTPPNRNDTEFRKMCQHIEWENKVSLNTEHNVHRSFTNADIDKHECCYVCFSFK